MKEAAMAYTAQSRDRYKTLAAAVTGVTTFAGVGVAGAATGLAARQTALDDQAGQQAQASQGQAPLQPRPRQTVVRLHVVHRVSEPGVTSVGPGGVLTAPPPGVSGSGGAVPPMQPPPQPPAPTSGS